MQFKATVVALALAATSRVAAQGGISDLPQCALQPSIAAIGSTGCSATDIKCICSDTKFITSLQPAIEAACSPADIAKTAQVAQQLCESVGVTLSLPSGSSSTSAPVSSSATTAPGPASVTTTSVATSTVVVGTGTGTGAPAPTQNGTITTATPSPTIVPGAAANVGVQSGLLALAGAAAMFFAL